MNTPTVMQRFVQAFNHMDIEALDAHLSDQLQFHGPAPQPLSRAQFIGMLRMLKTAFPDIAMNIELVRDDNSTATITSAMQGTHTGNLDMTSFGMGVIPPTGKSINLPKGYFDYALVQGRVVEIRAQPNPGGGFEGIMAQIGMR